MSQWGVNLNDNAFLIYIYRIYNIEIVMGNNGNKPDRVVPSSGFRVISITKNIVASQMGTNKNS